MHAAATTFLAAAVALAAYVTWSWKSALRKAIPGIPYHKPSFPFGNLLFIKKHGGYAEGFAEVMKLGPVAGFWFYSMQWVLLLHHEDIKTVLTSTTYRNPHRTQRIHQSAFLGEKVRGCFLVICYRILGASHFPRACYDEQAVIFLMKEEWKAHRAAMNKAFHIADLKGMASQFVAVGNHLCGYLESCAHADKVVDMVIAFKAATLDVIGRTAFGYDFGAVQGLIDGTVPAGVNEFEYLMQEMIRRQFSLNPFLEFYWLPTAANREHARCKKVIRSILSSVVEHRLREQRENQNENRHDDLLQHMMNAAREDSSGLITPESFTDSLLTLIFAGYDTTSLALSFGTWLLSQHENARAAALLRAELDREISLLDHHNITADTITGLRYCKASFEETMRLYPPVPFNRRALTSEVTLSNGVTLPEGTVIAMPIYLMQRDPHNWPDEPEKFKPERFHVPADSPDGLPVGGRHPAAAFVPFSMGRRDCVGRNLAVMEGVTLLAMVHSKFEFTPVAGYEMKAVHTGFIQCPKNGLPVHVSLRKFPSSGSVVV